MGLSGAIRLITAWQMPTHSFRKPKSDRKTIERVIVRQASSVARPRATPPLCRGRQRS